MLRHQPPVALFQEFAFGPVGSALLPQQGVAPDPQAVVVRERQQVVHRREVELSLAPFQ
ncbi:hypothetical protein D3C81_1970140 [compost metagenome]